MARAKNRTLFILVVVSVFLMASSAFSSPYLWNWHASIASLEDGHSVYTGAKFYRVYMDVIDDDTTATDLLIGTSGNITFSGGTYSYTDGKKFLANSGTSRTFRLLSVPDISAGNEGVDYNITDSNGGPVSFLLSADSGLNGVNVSWNFPEAPSLNGQGTISRYRTTQEQLASFVPYVEFVGDAEKYTGLKWRVVSSSDLSAPVSQDFRMRVRIQNVFTDGYNNLYRGSWVNIPAGEVPEGSLSFDEPINVGEVFGVSVRLGTFEDTTEGQRRYEWRFFTSGGNPELSVSHNSWAALTNGKSDYSNVKFMGLALTAGGSRRPATAEHFTAAGQITIPGGNYTIISDDDIGEELGSVSAGTDRTFTLKMSGGVNFGAPWVEYQPVNDGGEYILLGGNAETGLNGKTITWTFPAALNMNGSGVLPAFKPVSEQLTSGVPYVELTSSDGKITGATWRIVRASDTSTPIAQPSYRTEVMLFFDNPYGEIFSTAPAISSMSGTAELPEPVPSSELVRVRVKFWTYEDEAHPVAVQWSFTPAGGSSGGGGDDGGDGDDDGGNGNGNGGGTGSGDNTVPVSTPRIQTTRLAITQEATRTAIISALRSAFSGISANTEVSDITTDGSVTISTTSRTSSDVSSADIPSGETPAALLNGLTITQAKVYVFSVSLSNLVEGAPIYWHSLLKTAAGGMFMPSADGNTAGVFFNADGETTTTVPSGKRVDVAAYLEPGYYEPVITTTAAVPGTTGGGGGGCYSGISAVFAVIAGSFLFVKRR
ncbi:MAG: hypothetical protein IJG65_03860 [Synergistaceae bacterium]|nr:hypothetical protein [Synergistaceae bacterium]